MIRYASKVALRAANAGERWIRPNQVERVFSDYDQGRGYSAYHEVCKKAFARIPVTAAPMSDLNTVGYEYFNVFGPEIALDMRRELDKNHELSLLKRDSSYLVGFHITDHEWIEVVLRQVLNTTLDERLCQFFSSEYMVHWLAVSVAPKAEAQQSVSFRWHCDKGPAHHLKLIVYLNDSEAHGGNTEFINLDDTSRVAAKGYVFGWTKLRTSDVSHLSAIAGREIQTHIRRIRAGDAVLFQPANVLHRGVSPKFGKRYTITLCLLPSPVHWTQSLESGCISDLTKDAKWHQDAMCLVSRMSAGEYELTKKVDAKHE